MYYPGLTRNLNALVQAIMVVVIEVPGIRIMYYPGLTKYNLNAPTYAKYDVTCTS